MKNISTIFAILLLFQGCIDALVLRNIHEESSFIVFSPFHYYRATNQWQDTDRVLTSTARQVSMQSPNQGDGQKWRFSPIAGESSFRLSTHQSGFENSLSFGANQQLELHPTKSQNKDQLWTVSKYDDVWSKIHNVQKGDQFSIDVINDGTNDKLHVTNDGHFSGQYWKFEQLSPIEELIDTGSYYRLTTWWQGEGKSLDVINDGTNNKLILADTGNYSGQLWRFTPLESGFFQLSTLWQGVQKPLTETSRNIELQGTGKKANQVWKLIPTGKGYWRLAAASLGDGYNLDVINDGTNNKLTLAETGDYSGQYWKLTKVRKI